MEVEEWVFTGFGRQREQVCSEGWPGRFAGEFRDDVVGLVIEPSLLPPGTATAINLATPGRPLASDAYQLYIFARPGQEAGSLGVRFLMEGRPPRRPGS